MTLTTTEYWDVDGQNLHNLAFNIETLGGRLGVPPLKGEDWDVPLRPGEVWVPKLPGSRVLTLAMWVRGTDEDGAVPADQQDKFNANWKQLQRLFWRTDRQIVLTKRWKEGGVLKTAVAKAEFSSGLDPTMFQGANRGGKFTVDLKLADPYFYGAALGPTVLGSVDNVSDDVARKVLITLAGGGPYTLTNTTTGRILTVNNTGTIDLDIWEFTAVKAASSVIGDVTTSGGGDDPFWMPLVRGVNAFTISGGSASLTYTPVYL